MSHVDSFTYNIHRSMQCVNTQSWKQQTRGIILHIHTTQKTRKFAVQQVLSLFDIWCYPVLAKF